MSVKVAPPGAITREVLRQFCAQYPSQTLSDEFVKVEGLLGEAIGVDRGTEAGTVAADLTREAPHKLDENMWRNRQQNEHIVDLAQQLASAVPDDLKGDVEAVGTKGSECLAAIVKLQKDQYDHVQRLVNKFLPNDFRTRMFIAYQKRSEQHAADDLDNYMKRGGTIAGKYDRLWEAQLKRRQMLAAVGNASGVFKALIRYLAGVPQALLDFIHTINDDVGPMEEIRVTYGPVLYRLTAFVNRIHVLLAITQSVHATVEQDALKELLQLADRAITIYQTELAACLVTTLAVFQNSPMISVAEDAEVQAMSGQKTVNARGDFRVTVDVKEEHIGGTLEWEFSVESKDIEFSATFTPTPGEAVTLAAARRCYYHEGTLKGTHKLEQKGTAVFLWNNTFSVMTRKVVTFAVNINGDVAATVLPEVFNESL